MEANTTGNTHDELLRREVETQLLQMLIDNAPAEMRSEIAIGQANTLMNGPQIKADNPEAVTDQAQEDDVLESLGF